MRIVVDASVALKWVLDEAGSEPAVALRGEELIAPALWLAEAANALWRHVQRGQITADQADLRFGELLDAPVASIAVEPHIRPALRLATELGHPVYDCLYLALALHYDTHVVTADRRFTAAAGIPAFTGRVQLLGGE